MASWKNVSLQWKLRVGNIAVWKILAEPILGWYLCNGLTRNCTYTQFSKLGSNFNKNAMLATRSLLAQVVYVLRWTLFSTWLQKLFNLYIAHCDVAHIPHCDTSFASWLKLVTAAWRCQDTGPWITWLSVKIGISKQKHSRRIEPVKSSNKIVFTVQI